MNKTFADQTHEILHGSLASLVDTFHILEDMVCVTVNHSNTDIIVILVLHELLSGYGVELEHAALTE